MQCVVPEGKKKTETGHNCIVYIVSYCHGLLRLFFSRVLLCCGGGGAWKQHSYDCLANTTRTGNAGCMSSGLSVVCFRCYHKKNVLLCIV